MKTQNMNIMLRCLANNADTVQNVTTELTEKMKKSSMNMAPNGKIPAIKALQE